EVTPRPHWGVDEIRCRQRRPLPGAAGEEEDRVGRPGGSCRGEENDPQGELPAGAGLPVLEDLVRPAERLSPTVRQVARKELALPSRCQGRRSRRGSGGRDGSQAGGGSADGGGGESGGGESGGGESGGGELAMGHGVSFGRSLLLYADTRR